VHALDLDPPRGALSWMRSGPVEQALEVARDREPEALRELEELLADGRASPRLRRNAVPVLAQLYVLTAGVPNAEEIAEEIYDARHRGERFDPHQALKQSLDVLLADPDVEVSVAAAVELLQITNPGELPALRERLAPFLPLLRARRGDALRVQLALLGLGGAPDMLARLTEIAAGAGPLPPDLELVLAALERDPHEAAAPLLARIFPRLQAITEPHAPAREVIGGTIPIWDAVTSQAVLLFRRYLGLVSLAEVPAAVELLRAASPALAAVLVTSVEDLEVRGAALAGAAAADPALPVQARGAAIQTLTRLARVPTLPGGLAAIERLQGLRADPALGGVAQRALSGLGAARS